MTLFLPNGNSADKMDFVMFLSTWGRQLRRETQPREKEIEVACMGHPTYPIYPAIAATMAQRWQEIHVRSGLARHAFNGRKMDKNLLMRMAQLKGATIDYDDPQGKLDLRKELAITFTQSYKVDITAEDILFTSGGAGGLHLAFKLVNEKNPGGLIVTPFPHYPIYAQSPNNLFPIHLSVKNGYRLTADLVKNRLEDAQKQAERSDIKVSAFVLNDPHNPTGTVLTKDELKEIAQTLRDFHKKNPDFIIICDEAYSHLTAPGKDFHSLLSTAPELNIIVSKSATKAHSVSGERMAILLTRDKETMGKLVEMSIPAIGHVPLSIQYGYTAGTCAINTDSIEKENIRNYYRLHVDYAQTKVKMLDIGIPAYDKTDGTFYVMCDLSEFIGEKLAPDASRALGSKKIIESDIDICLHLLFNHDTRIALSPLSPFGMNPTSGLMRITCSNYDALTKIFERLEGELINVRQHKQKILKEKICCAIQELRNIDTEKVNNISHRINDVFLSESNREVPALQLKKQNMALQLIFNEIEDHFPNKNNEKKQSIKASMSIVNGLCCLKEIERTLDALWRKHSKAATSEQAKCAFFKRLGANSSRVGNTTNDSHSKGLRSSL